MTIAHGGSHLPLSKMGPVLPEGMILFPLDGRVENTTRDIPVLQNLTTFREDAYAFSGAVSVEDETTNLHSGNLTGLETYTVGQTPNVAGTVLPNGFTRLSRLQNGSVVSEYVQNYSVVVAANTTYTESVILKFDNANYVPSSFFVTFFAPDVGRHNKIAGSLVRQADGSFLAWATYTTKADELRIRAVDFYLPTVETGWNYVDVGKPMFEQKDHPTSYVVGTRARGQLNYDITSLGMGSAGCISCWIYNSQPMANGGITDSNNNKYIIKAHTGSDPYKNAMTLWIQQTTSRYFRFWSGIDTNNQEHIISTKTVTEYGGIGAWNHFVIQWDKNGLPSGYKKEMYINGVRESYSNTTLLPSEPLTKLYLGTWDGSSLLPATLFEQLAIHPSKGFSAEEIYNWYSAQAPFFDFKDKLTYF